MPGTSKSVLSWFGIALVPLGFFYAPVAGLRGASPQAVASRTPSATTLSTATSSQRELLNKYCVVCHNERLRTGQITFEKVDLEDIGNGAELWEKVLRKLRSGEMPPARMPRPDQAAMGALTSWLTTSLDRAAAAKPNPGRIAIHRLNQGEYANARSAILPRQGP